MLFQHLVQFKVKITIVSFKELIVCKEKDKTIMKQQVKMAIEMDNNLL